MSIEFRLLDEDGDPSESLPDLASFSLSPVFCDAGAVEFTYPRDGKNWQSIRDLDEFRVGVWIDGVRQPRLDAWLKEVAGDDAQDAAVWKFTGHFNNGRLAEAVIYPKNWPSYDPLNVKQRFVSATAGAIVRTVVQQAQARGTLLGITTGSFSSTLDSDGTAWNKLLTVEYAPQLDYLELLRNLYEQQVAEFEMVGDDLRLYVFGALSADRTLENPPLVFRRGRDLIDSPRKRSTRDLGTVMLAAGTEGLYVERVDAPGVASRRRIERKVAQGQVADTGTLTAYADAELSRINQAKMEKTHGLSFADGSPRPMREFEVGDWAYSDMGRGLERLRIRQWVLSLAADGTLGGSVTMNDFFAEQQEVLSRRIAGIVGGSTITGGSQAVVPVPSDLVDGLAPAAPSAPILSSDAYVDDQGHTFAQVSASWLQVTTNSDGTILEDLSGYRVRWQQVGQTSWRIIDVGNTTSTAWSPVAPGINVNVQVQAYDRAGNDSLWSSSGTIFTADDSTPPEAPSTPLVDVYLGLLRVRWDGKTASGAALAPDQNYVEVHVSNVNGFTPNRGGPPPTTIIDTVSGVPLGGGTTNSFAKLPYNTTWYAKLVAVDHSGNASVPSAQGGPATTAPVVSLDIFDGAVGTAKIADLAITTAKINDLAVNNAKIGDVSAGKITAGLITAEVTVSGRFTTALTGARLELNGIGIQAWDATGLQTISLNGVSNLLMGEFRTANSGRRIQIGSSGAIGELNFYAPDGTRAFVRGFTESTGVEALQFGIPITGATSGLWNRINYNDNEWASYRTRIHEFHYLTGNRFAVFSLSSKNSTATADSRLQVTDTGHTFTINTDEFMELVTNGNPSQGSILLRLFTGTASNGLIYGGAFRFSMTTPGADVGLDARYFDDSVYIPLRASAFTVSSSEKEKYALADAGVDGTDVLLRTKIKSWRRKPPKISARQPEKPKFGATQFREVTEPLPEGPVEYGPTAEQAPAEIVTTLGGEPMGINLGSTIAMLILAFQDAHRRLSDLEGASK